MNLETPEVPRKKRKKGGVKLLSDSKYFLEVTEKSTTEDTESTRHNVLAKSLKNKNKIDSEVTKDLLKQVAISAEDILSKKEVKNWSKRSKAAVFHYKKTKNGQLKLVESEIN